MAQNFSNVLSGSALGNALNNKLNPSPLSFSALPKKPVPGTTPLTTNGSTPQYATYAQPTPTQSAYGQSGVQTGYGNATTTKPQLAPMPSPYTQPKVTTIPSPTQPQVQTQTPTGSSSGYTNNQTQTNTSGTTPTITPQSGNTGLYGQLVEKLAGQNVQNNPDYQNQLSAYQKAVKSKADFDSKLAQKYGAIENNPIPLEFQQGREQVLARQAASQDATLQGAITQAQEGLGYTLTGQGLTNQSLGQATTATAPIQAPYTSQVLSPVTGQSIQGGGAGPAGGGLNPLNNIDDYAQKVVNGQMTIDQATSALGGSPAFAGALNQAITKINPNFNFTQSAASAQTQALGQQIKTAADSTNKALDTLSSSFTSLPGIQTAGIPATNSVANYIAGAFGQPSLTAYKTALADARSQLIGVLNSSGGTPTGNEATALQYLPDNMTVQQFNQNIGTPDNPGIVRQLVQQKVSSFQGSGVQGQNQSSTGSSGGNSGGWF